MSQKKKQTKRKRRKINKNDEVYCICHQPYDGKSAMIECPNCSEWFHYNCINIKANKICYWDEFFPCPFCQNNSKTLMISNSRCKNNIHNRIENAENIQELSSILKTFPFDTIKQFVTNQTKNDNFNKSVNRYFKCNCINDIFGSDIIQLIISFDRNRNKHKIVCKQWNKLCNSENSIQSRKQLQKIKQQIIGDKKETHLMDKIDALRFEKDTILRKIDRDKLRIEEKYEEMIKDLEKLSMYECKDCGKRSHNNVWLVKCKTCNQELCDACMLRCEAGDGNCCESEERYCYADCDEREVCDGCDRALCAYCFERCECQYCDKKICESCVKEYTRYDSREPSPDSWDNYDLIPTTCVSLCERCYECEEFDHRHSS